MSKLPLRVTYAVMATVELGLFVGEDTPPPLQAKAIAQRQGIPYRFIEQILHMLKQAGLVISHRGAQGGYSLSKPPALVTLAEIVQAANGTPPSNSPYYNNAFSRGGMLNRQNLEPLLSVIWQRLHEAELEILNSISLQTLIDQYQQLVKQDALMYHI